LQFRRLVRDQLPLAVTLREGMQEHESRGCLRAARSQRDDVDFADRDCGILAQELDARLGRIFRFEIAHRAGLQLPDVARLRVGCSVGMRVGHVVRQELVEHGVIGGRDARRPALFGGENASLLFIGG